MKKIKFVILGIVVCLSIAGCSKSNTNVNKDTVINSSKTTANESPKEDVKTEKFILTVWVYYFDKDDIEKTLKELYPNAEVKVVDVHDRDSQKIIDALASADAPDVVLYNSYDLGNFNTSDAFEDLSQAKYKVEDIKSIFKQEELDQCRSFGGKKLIALPFTPAPTVTYYRKDILEKYGIPTDPDELGNLMEKPEGWLTIAKALKKDNKSAVQWIDEFIKINLNGYGCFDKDMNLIVDNEKMKENFKLSKEIYELSLAGNNNIWTEQGKKAVKDGQIAMVYLNKWGEDYLKQIAPETSGNWRATRLPLGMYDYQDTNIISISSSSKYKTQAWELVKNLVKKYRSYDVSAINQEKEFLGNQKSNILYEDLGNKMPKRYPTTLDSKVNSIILNNLNANTDNYLNGESIIDSNKLKISNSISSQQKILSDYLIKIRKP